MQGPSLPSAFALNPAAALRGQALRQASGSLNTGPTMVPLLDLQTTASQAVPPGSVPSLHAAPSAAQHPPSASQLPTRQSSANLQSSTDRLVSLLVSDPRFIQALQASNAPQAAAAAIDVMKAHLAVFVTALSRQSTPATAATYSAAQPQVPTMVPQASATVANALVSATSSMLESASPTKRALEAEAPARAQARRDSGTRRGEIGRELKPGEIVKITHGNKRTADHIVGQFAKVVSVETNGWVNCQLVTTNELVRIQQRYLATATPLPPPSTTPATMNASIIPTPPTSAPIHQGGTLPAPVTNILPAVPAPAAVPLPVPAAVPSIPNPPAPVPSVPSVLPSAVVPTVVPAAVPVPLPVAVPAGTVGMVPVMSAVPPPVIAPRPPAGELVVDACGVPITNASSRGITKMREVVRALRKELLALEEEIPWSAVKEAKWRSGRNAWRRAVRNAESVPDLAAKLGDLHDNLRTDKTQGLFQRDGTWHRSLHDCMQGRAHYQTFQSVWNEWRSAVHDWLNIRAQNLPPPADPLSQANASRAAAALDVAALFGTDYVEQVPLESILNHHRESFAVLKSMVERERARVAAKIEALNSATSSDGSTIPMDPQLASSLLSVLHDDTAMKGVTGLVQFKSFQSDMDTDMDEGSDVTDLNDSDMD